MSTKKAQAASWKFKFGNDDALTPAINVAFQEIVQWAQLYRTGDLISRENCRKRLMDVAESWVAWKFEEAQNAQNGFKGAKQRREARQHEWDLWQKRADDIYAGNPHLSKTAVCTKVAEEFGVTREAVGNHVTGVGKPRKSRK
ncbi:hypothetical protein V1687_02545 [Pseudomonas putida]|uniref:hypothetical protein n=1 Tax=Pseudomonas putida TaxID=303 RepID=UPI002ED1962C|nr:hypothetical protein V1687_02545 [Pseudomonas putida]